MKIIVKIETETVLNLFLLLCFNGNISDEKGILFYKKLNKSKIFYNKNRL